MKLHPTLSPGNSAVQLRTNSDSQSDHTSDTIVFRDILVHGNINAGSQPELHIDIAALERQARAARSAWIGSKLKALYRFLLCKFAGVVRTDMKDDRAASAGPRSREYRAFAAETARSARSYVLTP